MRPSPWLLALALSPALALASPPEGPRRAAPDHHDDELARISFDEALGLSDARDDLAHERRAVDQRRRSGRSVARQPSNPQIQLQPGVRVTPRDELGPELQAQVTQSWSLGGIKKATRASVDTQTDVLDAEARGHALSARLDAAHAWIALWGLESQLRFAEDELEVAAELTARITEALELGVSTRADLAEAEQYELEVDQRVRSLEGEVHDMGLELARASGGHPRQPLGTRGEPPRPALPSDADIELAFDHLDRLPSVQLYDYEALAAKARGVEARAQNATKITAGGALQLESPRSVIVSGIVGVQLPIVNRGQREQLDATSDLARAQAHRDRSLRDASADLAWNVHEIQHSRAVEQSLAERRIPGLERLVAAREELMASGEETSFELLDARRRLLGARGELAAIRAERLWAETRLWMLLAELEMSEARR